MSNKKVITTLVTLINNGITFLTYYDSKSHNKLKDSKAYYEDETLCFKIIDKVYKFYLAENNGE